MFLLSPEADWASEEVDSLSSDQRAAVVLIIRASRSVYPPANCRYTEPASSVRVPLDKVEPRTDPEVSEELEEWRRLRLFIYYSGDILHVRFIGMVFNHSYCPVFATPTTNWNSLTTTADWKQQDVGDKKEGNRRRQRSHFKDTSVSRRENHIAKQIQANKLNMCSWVLEAGSWSEKKTCCSTGDDLE